MTETAAGAGLRRAQANTTRLGALLVIASSLALALLLPRLTWTAGPLALDWWMLAIGFAVAEIAVFHLEINREAHTFSISEVPTVIALLFASPVSFIVGRLVGEAVTLTLRDRQSIPKLVFNLSMFLGECVVALAVFNALGGSGAVTEGRTWLAATGAVLASDTLSILCVLLAIRWHGAEPEPRKLFTIGALTAVVNTTISVAASLLLVVNRMSAVLLAVVVGVVYIAYRSFANLTQRHSDLRMLYEFTTVVSRNPHAEAVLDEILGQAQRLLRASYAEIELDGPDGVNRRIRRGDDEVAPVPFDDRTRALVVRQVRAIVVSRSSKDAALREWADRRGLKDAVLAPLSGEHGVMGTILVANRLGEVSSFDEEDARLIETFANHASIALENGRLIDRLSTEVREREHQATHDALTGLPNRLLFFGRVRDRIAEEQDRPVPIPFAVMLMDLDRFKEVNDTLGHHAGDLVLQEVAHRLKSALPPDVTIARLGGDEFALLLPRATTSAEATATATRLLEYLVQPCYVEGVMVDVGASIGLSWFDRHDIDAPALVRRADVAMYNAKSAAERIAWYDAEGDSHSLRRLTLTSALREAVDSGSLHLHYQPKVSLTDERVAGVEALARWEHPDLGVVRPDEFIPVAEQTGLIVPLTALVLAQALRDAREWRAAGCDVPVAVNVGVRALLDDGVIDTVAELLRATETPPGQLTLEITETGAMTDPRRTIVTLHQLADLGVRLSVDDFGTGYSSLAYLQRLPVHEVKIDRSFVMTMAVDENSATIVRTVIDLARNLGLATVAEGVEDAVACEQLVRLGCAYAQGYYFSRPMPSADLVAWVQRRSVPAAA